MQIRDVLTFLRTFAPPQLSENWDNTGLLVGREQDDVTAVLTCLTLTPEVAQEAVARGVQLVVSHHPVLFRPVQRIAGDTAEGAMLLDLIRAGIGVYSPHTSYDSAREGINQQWAEAFGLASICPLRSFGEGGDTDGLGAGRQGLLHNPVRLEAFVEVVKQTLGVAHTQYVGEPNRCVQRVAIACGAAAEFMTDAAAQGCDVLLTGEARFHACLEARTLDIALVLPGHYATERPAMERLAEILQHRFPELDVAASRAETDPIRWA
ncbi:MAG: NGG1p interacting factor 3 protein, NIF3 [Candidatus Entotheonella gemina]|uniref:GTP cyclohydrolase 1 type 2 homolog n=1 Tax=Candidatus Entotheonella gemina TaxID=1429439 RepID=W4M7Q3_9BACT|nr:MAG: NGG1p interacting factor 3 protein, NIF3 [Candidatus Entotheonella gemina]